MKTVSRIKFLLFPALILCTSFICIFGKKSGIEGNVYKVSGNQMPSFDRVPPAPVGIKTTILVYELTNMSQVQRQGQTAFYSSISTRLIQKFESNDKGHFKIRLPPGKYSLFMQTDKGFYSNNFDSQNNISPVEVIKKKMSKVELRLDYAATY